MDQERLRTELATFQRLLPSMLGDEGKFALIIGDSLAGVFASYEDALNAGYAKAKLSPFLVKKISGVGSVAYFTRFAGPHCLTSAS